MQRIKNQFTVRLNEDQVNKINQHLEEVIGNEQLTNSEIFFKMFEAALHQQASQENSHQYEQLISEYSERISNDAELINNLQQRIQELEVLTENLPQPTDIVIQLPDNLKHYFWGILQLSKRMDYAHTYGELIGKMLSVFQLRNEFTFSQDDLQYLKTLEYDPNTATH